MNRELTEEELVWDRLKNGIKPPPEYSYIEELCAEIMARELAKEIDDAVLNDLRKMSKQ